VDYAAYERDRSLRECHGIADAYNFTGSTRAQYLSQCMSITSASVPMTPLYPLGRTQYSTIGQPDQFGPLGYRGPTWEQFNHRFETPPR
jgi:hypothetical protein